MKDFIKQIEESDAVAFSIWYYNIVVLILMVVFFTLLVVGSLS